MSPIEQRLPFTRPRCVHVLFVILCLFISMPRTAAAAPELILGWNHPWIAYGHDFGANAWGHDGLSTNGWTVETFPDSRGFADSLVVSSSDCGGSGALRITANLAGGDPNRSSGEVHVVVGDHGAALCPRAGASSLDLRDVVARVKIRLPPGSAGPAMAPNGVQFLFKTKVSEDRWASLYTAWQNIRPEWEGQCVTFTAQVTVASAAYVDPDFDPAKVSLLGLKIGINSQSSATLVGSIDIEEYVLESSPPTVFNFAEAEIFTQFKGLRALADGSLRVVRVFVFADGRASPEFAESGHVTGIDPAFSRDFDVLVDAAQRSNVLLLPVLLDFSWFAQRRVVSGVPLGGHADVIRDPVKRQSFLDMLAQLFRQYGRHPAIAGWDILNEPEWIILDGERVPDFPVDLVPLADMQEFVRAVANLVHRLTDHAVTLGSARLKWRHWWTGLGLDFYQFHWYDKFADPERPPEDREPFPWPHAASLNLDRPIVIGEVPLRSTGQTPATYIREAQARGYAGLLFWSCRAGDEFSGF